MNKKTIRCKSIKVKEYDGTICIRPEILETELPVLPEKTIPNKTYYIWQIKKEHKDGTFDVEIILPDEHQSLR